MSSLRSLLISKYADHISKNLDKTASCAIRDQNKLLQQLVRTAKNTRFGKAHNFSEITDYQQFIQQVPTRDYEQLRTYIDDCVSGQSDVLWPGRPKYFAKTSGTTSGIKYLPISSQSIKDHIATARNAILNYASKNSITDLFDGKMVFLSGSPRLTEQHGIPTGRLSGIVHHEIPFWIRGNRLPTMPTNVIEDWEEKLGRIVEETCAENLTLISGIPPWLQMYFEKLLDFTGAESIIELFPKLQLLVHGGVNYAPYRKALDRLIGKPIATLETYPASEGFIAFQNDQNDEGLLLNTNGSIFYEFVPLSELGSDDASRLGLAEVSLGVDYAVVMSTTAGLWAYLIGDTVRFTSLDPYKVKVSGRTKHFISAFGEHVISAEVERAMGIAIARHGLNIIEFSVAPQISPPGGGAPYHEWIVEFAGKTPANLDVICKTIDAAMTDQNIYYKDLITNKVLRTAQIRPVSKGAFRRYMSAIGKLGGQNKVPRLMNTRGLADRLD